MLPLPGNLKPAQPNPTQDVDVRLLSKISIHDFSLLLSRCRCKTTTFEDGPIHTYLSSTEEGTGSF
jgi:hypothetical protein